MIHGAGVEEEKLLCLNIILLCIYEKSLRNGISIIIKKNISSN